MNSDGLATEEPMLAKCPGCGSHYNGNSQFCSRSCLNAYDPTEEATEAEEEEAEAIKEALPERPMLRRSYAFVPGQTEDDRAKMIERLDAANLAAGKCIAIPCWEEAPIYQTMEVKPTPKKTSPKRSLDDLVAPKPKAKKRKAKVTAVRKDFAAFGRTGPGVWELTLEDGSLVLAKEIVF